MSMARTILSAMIGLILLSAGAAKAAQPGETDFPTRPVTLLVPAAPGGGWDADAQFIRAEWSKLLGRNVIIRYDSAGGGLAALQEVARESEPYTMIVIGSEFAAINLYSQHSQLTMSKDFYPLLNISTDVMTVFVPVNSPYHGMKDLIEAARKKRISIGVAGVGSSNELMALILRQVTGVGKNLNVVPFNGGSTLRTEIAGGHLAAGISPSQGLIAFHDEIRPIGYFASQNPVPSFLKTTPVATQLSVKIPSMLFSSAIFVSSRAERSDPAAVAKLSATLKAALTDPSVESAMGKAGYGAYSDFIDSSAVLARLKETEAVLQQYGSLFRQ